MRMMVWFAAWLVPWACASLVPGRVRAAPPDAQCRARAQAALTAFTQGRYEQVNRHFAPAIADQTTADAMRAVWKQMEAGSGAFQGLGELQARTVNGQDVLVAPLEFAGGKLAGMVACNGDGQITGFRFVPASMLPAPADRVPGVVSTSLNVPSPLGPLPGMLTRPEGDGPFPAVVMVAGSGPGDMDETVGPNKPFRDMAIGLAKQGIATLRFDKRAHVYGMQMKGKPITVDDDETDDALSALQVLAARAHVDAGRLFVLGLSQGAMLAPRIAKRSGRLAGIVMMAAPARPMLDVMADQFRVLGAAGRLSAADVAEREKAIDAERRLLADADPARPPQGDFFHAPQSFWLSLHAHHQVEVARGLHLPMLILQGGKDYQVSPEKDFARWKKALAGHSDVTFRLYPGLFHLFMPGAGTPDDYRQAGHVSPDVVDDIAAWIRAR